MSSDFHQQRFPAAPSAKHWGWVGQPLAGGGNLDSPLKPSEQTAEG